LLQFNKGMDSVSKRERGGNDAGRNVETSEIIPELVKEERSKQRAYGPEGQTTSTGRCLWGEKRLLHSVLVGGTQGDERK